MKRLGFGQILGVGYLSFLLLVISPDTDSVFRAQMGASSASTLQSITGISPDHGSRGVNTSITIKGSGFSPGTRVSIWGGGTYVKGSTPTRGPANGLYCSGSYAYLACGQEVEGEVSSTPESGAGLACGVQIFQIQNLASPATGASCQPVSFFPLPRQANDICVFENYAYVATGSGLQILDIHNPAVPSLVSSLPIAGGALRISLYGQHIYIASDSGGLQIVDISDLNHPALAGSCLAISPGAGGAVSSNSEGSYVLDVVAEGSYAYLAAGWAGVKIIDISRPQEPRVAATFPCPGRFVMGVYKYQDYLYLSEMQDGVEILDILNPVSPVLVSHLTTPGLAHQVSIKGNYLYVADDYRGVEIFRHDLIAGCSLVGFQETPGWAVDLQVFDNNIFVADYQGGFQILDASNPRNPSIVSITDLLDGSTGGQVSGLIVQGNYAYVLSRSDSSFEKNWMKILDISTPQNPFVCGGTQNIGSKPEDLAVSQGYAYLVDGDIGLEVLNVTYKQSPQRVSFYDSDTSGGSGIFMRDNTLFLADSLASGQAGLKIFSLNTKMLPSLVGVTSLDSITGAGCAEAVYVAAGAAAGAAGDYAYLAAGDAGLAIFDIRNLTQPSVIATLPVSGSIKDVLVCGPYAYLANKNGLVQTINIGTPSTPSLASSCMTSGEPRALALAENYLYVSEGEAGFQVIDVEQPEKPLVVASFTTLTPAEDIVAEGEYIYTAIRNGLMVVRALKPCPVVSYVNSTTLNVSTPAGLAPGTYHVTMTDPNGTTTLFPNGFTIEANRPPVMEPIADNPLIAVYEGETLTLTIKATDPDGDYLIYDASLSKLPAGATLAGNIFSWKPGPGDSGLYPAIRFQVSDGDFIIEQEINFAVIDVGEGAVTDPGKNTPPILSSIGNKTVSEGNVLTFSLSASDAENDPFFFSASSMPDGALPDGATLVGKQFSWKPNFDQSGTYRILFTVREGTSGLMDSEEIQITVSNTNRPPELCLIPSQTNREEGKAISFLIEAFDPDSQDQKDLKITMLDAPAGAVLRTISVPVAMSSQGNTDTKANKVTACLLWTPAYGQAGTYAITFKAQDQQSSDQKTVSIKVAAAASAPALFELKEGVNIWLCPAGRAHFTSFAFLKELGADALYSLQAYDWDGTLLKSCSWLFGKPCGDDFLMDQSRIYRVQAKRNTSFVWPRN